MMKSSFARRSRIMFTVGFMSLGVALSAATSARADVLDLAEKCHESNDALACAAAGAPFEASQPDNALELYAVPCANQPSACDALIAYAQRLLKKKDASRAAQVLAKGCELKSSRACAALGSQLEEGERGIAVDAAKAAGYYDRACDLGWARSCLVLAVMVDDGRGARRDPARAARLRAKADTLEKAVVRPAQSPELIAASDAQCRSGHDPHRCVAAGAAVQDTDAVKAEEMFRIGCKIDKNTCGLWGFAVDRFRRDDPSRGQRILEEGCGQGVALACMVYADLSHAGYRSIPRNEQRAAELYEKSCTLGDAAGCRATASRFRGVKNVAKADELRDRAASLEAAADKALAPLQEKWIKDAPQLVARESYERELGRRRGEWRSLAARAHARWNLRMQRLAAVEAGSQPPPLTPAPKSDAQASASRGAAIKRMAKVLFP